jgi:ubiquinol-cytochrome c reductase cytochrome b subunit
MDFGWLIRGLHHFGSQTMMVLIALHMLQVVIAGAHLPPREVNWWLGLALLGVTFGLGLTGYLLPWDQKGYWATRVATNIAGNTPVIGDFLKKLLVGGDDYGNHTLTRFYALHVGVLPLTFIALLIAHIAVFRRHGITAPKNAVGEAYFWPGQAFRDLVVCLLVFGVMVGVVVYGHGSRVVPEDHQAANLYEDWAHAGQKGLGANLDAPADRDTPDYPARPEWYFLFLFQLLKYFDGDKVLIGTFVIPNAAMLLLFLLPLLGYGGMRKFGQGIGHVILITMLLLVGVLTLLAFADDSPEYAPKVAKWFGTLDDKDAADHGAEKAREMFQEKTKVKAEHFQESVEKAEAKARRAATLAMAGIPEEGARMLLRNDPLTKGHELFQANCAVCHSFSLQKDDEFKAFPKGNPKASDLGDWGSETWVRGLLNNPSDLKFFGNTELKGMKGWRKGVDKERKKMGAKELAEQDADFDTIARLLADQAIPPVQRDNEQIARNVRGMEAFKRQECDTCHTLGTEAVGKLAPELTNYGSADWVRFMVMSPGSPARFGKRNEMTAFRNKEGPGSEVALREFIECSKAYNDDFDPSKILQLSDVDRELLVRFMVRDYRVVFGGQPIAAAPK